MPKRSIASGRDRHRGTEIARSRLADRFVSDTIISVAAPARGIGAPPSVQAVDKEAFVDRPISAGCHHRRGVGGLTLAIALRQRGIEFEIYDHDRSSVRSALPSRSPRTPRASCDGSACWMH